PLLRLRAHERVRVRPAGHLDASPRMLLDRHPSAIDGPEVACEMASQAEAELLDLAYRRLFCERKHRVLLCVSGHDVAVVTVGVAGFEVAGQRDGDGDVFDLVNGAMSGDADHVGLGLAVLVVAENDGHRPLYVE